MERTSRLAASLPPGAAVLRRYQREWLRPDVIAGITVTAYLVPQVMAYAAVAGLPPVSGLWAIVPALLLYSVLGSSRQLSVGPESTTALMTAVAIAPLAAGDPARYAVLAAALGMIVGVLCVLAYVARLGFVADVLSRPILIGYLAGVALLMIVGQLSRVTGVPVKGDGFTSEIRSFVSNISDINGYVVAFSAAVLIALFAVRRYRPGWPGPLLVVLVATVVASVFDLSAQGIVTVGPVPAGLPKPSLPDVGAADLRLLLLPAIGVAVVGFTDNMLTGRAFAGAPGERVDANTELLALGAANVGAGLVQGFPVSSSGSRTALGNAAGSKTQMHSLVAAGAVVVVLVALNGLLARFPVAALGALVIYAALQLIELDSFRRLRALRTAEFALALAATIGVLAFDVLTGILFAVGLSVLDMLRRIARPHDAVLGFARNVPGMHDLEDYPDAQSIPGLVIYRYDAPLFFANAEDFRDRAVEAVAAERAPVEWFVLNAEANTQIDATALEALEALREDFAGRGIKFGMARVRHEIADDLARVGFVQAIGEDMMFATLPTAVSAFERRSLTN